MAENIEVGLELKDNMSSALGTVAKAISSFATKVDSGLTKVSDALADVDAAMRGMSNTAQSTMPKSMATVNKATTETVTRAEQLRRALKSISDVAGNPIDFGNIKYAGIDRLQSKLTELEKSIVSVNTKSSTALSGQIADVQGPQTRATGFDSAVNFGSTQREAVALTQQVSVLRQQLTKAFQEAANGSDGAAQKVVALTSRMQDLEGKAADVSQEYARGVQQIEALTAKANSELTRIYGQSAPQVSVKDLFPTQAQSQLEALENKIRNVAEQRIEIRALQDTFQQFGKIFPFLNKNLDATDANVLRMVNNLPRLRYALYDVSQNATIAGAAMVGAFAATATTAIALERQFADVVRTTNLDPASESARQLKEEFFALRQEIPVAFGELAKIGTLAGQLNIPAESVANFTETVAKFAATTDVSVEDAATAFGRLDKLIFGVDEQFEKLGSAILAVGTNAVATESQIIKVSQQISSIANLAGFSASEIIGFSSALASVGISPELARGIVTRTFSSINTAAAAGGEQLERFGRVAGVSGAEFGAAWNTNASATFVSFLKGLNEDGSVAEQTLRELGITSIRDIPSLLKLAQNYEEVGKQIGIAGEGFEKGTELQKQYDVIASTVAEKIKVLAGNFEILIATVGESANGFGFAIDIGIQFLQLLTALAKNPLGQALLNIVGVLTLVGGSLSLLVGVGAKIVAGFSAAATASISFKTTLNLLRTDLASVAVAQGGVANATTASAAAMNLNNLTTQRAMGLNVSNTAILRAQAAVIRENVAAMSLMQKVSLGAGIFGVAIAAATAIGEISNQLNKTAGTKATEFFGDISTVLSAVKQDTEDWKNSTGAARLEYETFTTSIEKGNEETDKSSQIIKSAAGANSDFDAAIKTTTSSIDAQTVAIGKNTEEAVRALSVSKLTEEGGALVKLFSDAETAQALQGVGINIENIISTGFSNGAQAGIAEVDAAIRQLSDLTAGGKTAATMPGVDLEAARNGLNLIKETFESSIGLEEVIRGVSAAQAAAGTSTEEFGDAIAQLNEQFFESEKLAMAQNSAMFDLGEAINQNGTSFDILTQAGQANQQAMISAMSAIAENSGSPLQAAANLQALYNQMLAAGVPASQMIMLANSIAQLSGGKALPAATISMKPFNAGLKQTKKNAKEASAQVRTLVDYANDLKKVFSRAFDIRFGSMEALDNIASGWLSIADSAESAREQISDLNDSINELNADASQLTADKALQEYFLSVAEAQGDTVTAEQIRANLAGINAELVANRNELAEANQDLADAQAEASTSLTGNSQAAINNRGEIRGMIQEYSEYISSLAAAGASQDTLNAAVSQSRADFLAQARALGFSDAELQPYLASFNDMSTAVGGVNAGVTVPFNIDPALQALAELEAASKTAANNISDSFGGIDSSIPVEPAKESLYTIEDRELRLFKNRVEANKNGIDWKSALGFDKAETMPPKYIKKPFDDAYTGIKNGAKTAKQGVNTEFSLIGTNASTQAGNSKNSWATSFGSIPTSIANQKPNISRELGAWATSASTNAGTAKNAWSGAAGSIPGFFAAQVGSVNSQSLNIGRQSGTNLNSGLSGNLNIPGIVSGNVNSASYAAGINGRTVGNTIGSSIRSGISGALDWLLGWNSTPRRVIRSITGFSEGGYTGAGGKYEAAGIVHRGEYVVPKSEVNQTTKLPYFMEQQRSFAQGGYVGSASSSTMMVMLSPEDRALLRNVGGSGEVVLYANNEAIARSANIGNKSIVASGGRP